MLIKMTCYARVCSDKAVFPLSTIGSVVVCNTDHCSHQICPVSATTGTFQVEFDMQPTGDDGYMTDHLKFHFFTSDAVPCLIAAGAVSLHTLNDATVHECSFGSNFQKVSVLLRITDFQAVDCTDLRPSALHDSVKMTDLMINYTSRVEDQLKKNLVVSENNGGVMFSKLLAIHNFDNQATSHLHYQLDFEPSQYTSDRFLLSGITMTSLVETLWLQRQTVEDVMQLNDADTRFTRFVVMVTQACMRSAYLCPYSTDMNVMPTLSNGKHVLAPGESFKRPFGEPFSPDNFHSIQNDDCEGEAVFIRWLFASFAHLDKHPRDAYFPSHLFSLSEDDRARVFALALRIGGLIKEQKLFCDVVVVSASAASLQTGPNQPPPQLMGHATCVIMNLCGDQPHDVLTEGTNCLCPDVHHRVLTVQRGDETKDISISSVANVLTRRSLMRNASTSANRAMLHVDFSGSVPFYRHMFMQNNFMLASKKDEADRLTYGVSIEHLNDNGRKTYLPVHDSVMPKANQRLNDWYELRRPEIHPPLTPVEQVLQATKHWAPLSLYEPEAVLKDREFLVCMYTTSCTDPDERAQILAAKQTEVEKWNQTRADVGHSAAFMAFDSVYHVLCLYVDDTEALKRMLMSSNEPKSEGVEKEVSETTVSESTVNENKESENTVNENKESETPEQ